MSVEDRHWRLQVADVVRAYRMYYGVSQGAIARNAGVNPSTVSLVERGLTTPKPETLDRLGLCLGLDLLKYHPEEGLSYVRKRRRSRNSRTAVWPRV